MATYAIGDIHGCLTTLQRLLDHIGFNNQDTLWLCGDMINRGPDSLQTLLFLKQLGSQVNCILGNHEIHLLAVGCEQRALRPSDTLSAILSSEHKSALLDWLSKMPLMLSDDSLGYTMVHAGIPPFWSIEQAHTLAKQAQAFIRSPHFKDQAAQLFDSTTATWQPEIKGIERVRFILNALTRMRFLTSDKQLDFNCKKDLAQAPESLRPWFELRKPSSADKNCILFGHWASLSQTVRRNGTGVDRIIALDTGCVWGNRLTALRLDDRQIFQVNAVKP